MPPIQIQPRDIEILRLIFEHRFVQPAHMHALLPDGSLDRLNRRMRLLWQHRYLERPRAVRPTKILTEELVYGLGNKGAQLLQQVDSGLRIANLDWAETPGKQKGLPYIDHQLGVATFMVCLRVAATTRGAQLRWTGHFRRRDWLIHVPGEQRTILPDAYFALQVPDRGVAHHYLEVDRGNVSVRRMQERYEGYLRYWERGVDKRPFRHFRVLTVSDEPERAAALRKAALPVGRGKGHSRSWQALMFSDFRKFDLDEPKQILGPIWQYPDGGEHASLV